MTSLAHRAGDIPERIHAHMQRAAEAFAHRFGRLPSLAAAAPGRVNLIGEHTDYNEGFVLPIAIERETVIVADTARGSASTLLAADLNAEIEVNLARPLQPQRGAPGNYLLGVADQFQRLGLTPPNLDVLVTSTVPVGAGLSSSAALEVAFTLLLARGPHVPLERLEVARLCQRAEHAFPGTPCGIMDMYISAAAREGHALLIDCRSDEARPVKADFEGMRVTLLVIYTGVHHDLAAGEYARRRATCESAARTLGVASLREATIESLNTHGLSDLQRRRALHVIAENTRTILAAEALAVGDVDRFGAAMFQSHASLRDLFEVSCDELDALVDAARLMSERGAGVLGARMTGGGFGGCVIALCEAQSAERVGHELAGAFESRFARPPARMFTTGAAGGALTTSWPV